MHTNHHKPPQAAEKPALDAEVRARVPGWMKQGLDSLAASRILDNPDILREAVSEYLTRHGIQKPQPEKEAA